jgi:hypothetical protein
LPESVTSPSRASVIGADDKEEKTKREQRTDASQVAWAQVLAEAVLHQLPRFTLELAPPSADPGPLLEDAVVSADSPSHAPYAELDAGIDGALARGNTNSVESGDEGQAVLERLSAHFDDEQLGKVLVTVTRDARGLDIVIGVADAHVKALIEAERLVLLQALKGAGLRVARVEVTGGESAGTLLAPNPKGARSSTSSRGQNARVRAYRTSLEEESAATAENVDLTA